MNDLTYLHHIFLFLIILAIGGQTSKAGTLSDSTKFTTLTIRFDNYIGDRPLLLNEEVYENGLGQKFSLTTVNYFISNISLTQKNGKQYTLTPDESYFLVKSSEQGSKTIKLRVPAGQYQSISFTLGVDSLRSTMDLSRRKGALDPAGGMIDGMYWSWNSGYIFFKMEGLSPAAPLDKTGNHKFRFHIGGFGGYNKPGLNNIQKISLDFKTFGKLKLAVEKESLIRIKADLLRVFDGDTQVDLSKNASVMFGSFSSLVAKNYRSMFSVVSVQDDAR